MTSGSRELLSKDFRRGAAAILPMLIGVVPFGLIAGTTPVTGGLGMSAAVGFSTIVFAGASQLVAIDSLISGKGAAVAIMAAIAINLRLLLYSASLAPEFGRLPFRERMKIAYLLTDQAYAVTHAEAENNRAATPDPRVALDEAGTKNLYRYYMGAGLTLWGSWQIATIVGGLIGNSLPSDIPVDFAVPLVFLVLLVPSLVSPSAWVAALVGGGSTIAAAELGLDQIAVLIGALAGIVAGFLVETFWMKPSHHGEPDGSETNAETTP